MKPVKIFLILFVAVFLLNNSTVEISGQDKAAAPPPVKIENPESQKQAAIATNQNLNKNLSNERYRIGYQDTLEVTVFKHPELSQTVEVNPDGTIFLPRIDQPVEAACKTENELKNNITALYKQNYLRNPFVSVRVSNLKSQGFAVIGAVEKPGNFYLNRQVRLLELLALAGGQDVEFAGGKIQVARVGSDTGCQDSTAPKIEEAVKFLSYSLKEVLDGKQNPWMQPGDIISVLQAEEAYVVGNVIKPTKVLLREPITLTTAIASAGGLDSTAKTNKVLIQRQVPGSSVQSELVFDLKDIREKKIADPLLQANDIVSVGNDKGKSIQKGLLKIFTGGLPTIFTRVPAPF